MQRPLHPKYRCACSQPWHHTSETSRPSLVHGIVNARKWLRHTSASRELKQFYMSCRIAAPCMVIGRSETFTSVMAPTPGILLCHALGRTDDGLLRSSLSCARSTRHTSRNSPSLHHM